MKYGICLQSVIPVRQSQTEKSEQVSQLLFGETYTVIEQESNWIKIRCTFDDFTGWIDRNTAHGLSEESFFRINQIPQPVLDRKVIKLVLENGTCMTILPGSDLPFYDPTLNGFRIDKKTFQLNEKPETGAEIATIASVTDTAKEFMNAPYLWGGRSFFGIDCSGFTQVVFKINHIKVPRNASQQAFSGKPVNRLENAWPGDVAFFINEEGDICHVGIIMAHNKIIHASGHVRLDPIDSTGIFNAERQNYSHHLECIRRVF